MNVKPNTRYNYPQRNKAYESEIDLILATELMTVQSIKVYLDALETLLNKYHEEPATHTLRNLSRYVLRNNIDLRLNHPCYYLSGNHQQYLTETAEYIKLLAESLKPSNANRWDTIELITYNIETLISQRNATNDDIKKFIQEKFNIHPDKDYIELGPNLEIRLFFPETVIYIVRSWQNFSLPTSRHAVALIVCTTDLSSAPEEIFATGRLRTLSSLNHFNKFEKIWLQNPIQSCINMTENSIYRMKWKHSEFEQIILQLENLFNELRQISIQTHFAIEPKGHLVLTGVKSCLSLIHPLLKAVEALPDSEVRSTTTNRLEQTAFSLSAFFTNLSTRLNTKKYIASSLSNILINDGLYKHKQKPRALEHAFSEENLNTILAGNLACFYHNQKSIDVLTEVPMGAGFADVVVKYEKTVSAIIEGKLIKQLNQTEAKVLDGLNQLYNRYGDHNSILDTFGIELYLVVFAYDQVLNSLSKATLEAVKKFSHNHNIELQTHFENLGHLHFSYLDSRTGTGLPPKRRSIYIFYCNMEVVKKNEPEYRSQRKL